MYFLSSLISPVFASYTNLLRFAAMGRNHPRVGSKIVGIESEEAIARRIKMTLTKKMTRLNTFALQLHFI